MGICVISLSIMNNDTPKALTKYVNFYALSPCQVQHDRCMVMHCDVFYEEILHNPSTCFCFPLHLAERKFLKLIIPVS